MLQKFPLNRNKSFSAFLANNELHSKGYVDVDVSVSEKNQLIFQSEKFFEKAVSYKLVLVDAKEKNNKEVIDVLSNIDTLVVENSNKIFEKYVDGRTLLCYLAVSLENGYYFARLRKEGKSQIETAEESQFGEIFWTDNGRYLGSIQSFKKENEEYNVVPFVDARRNTINIKVYKSDMATDLVENKYPLKIGKKQSDSKKYPFKISVIMAVYNVEDYIEEALESLIHQDIQFENIEVILVNDGSTDDSGAICDSYAKKYPHNIVVIHKENGGAASARNTGKALARGKYLNFVDPDDVLDLDAFRKMYSFFEAHYFEIDVLCIPLVHFEALSGPYWQNYKFKKGTRIINLRKEYEMSNMNSAASLIKNEIAQKYEFDVNLPVAEDAKWLLQIMLEKQTLGVVSDTTYWYRRRENNNLSLIQSGSYKKEYYTNYFIYYIHWMREYCEKTLGYVPYFVQNTLMMDLQWRLKVEELPENVLSEEEKSKYIENIRMALIHTEDKIILSQQKIWTEHFMQALSLKYNKMVQKIFLQQDIVLSINNTLLKTYGELVTKIEFLEIADGCLKIEGYSILMGINADDIVETIIKIGERYYKCESPNRIIQNRNFIGKLYDGYPFEISIKLDDYVLYKDIEIYLSINNYPIKKKRITYDKFSPINSIYHNQYYCEEGMVLQRRNAGWIIRKCVDEKTWFAYEENYIQELKKKGVPNLEEIKEVRRNAILAKLYKKQRNPIWIISDRIDKADDNGEAFFRFLVEKKEKHINYYFAIKEESPDYQELLDIGNVVPMYTTSYKSLFLQSDCFISSQFDDFIYRPFQGEIEEYRDLLANHKFVFLQHGITKNDMSPLLNKYKKNIVGFVTASKKEYDSIMNYDYYYKKQNIWLTGFPRFDRLYNETKRIITIMPTWRKFLVSKYDESQALWLLKEGFENSNYYKFYKELVSNKKLLDAAKKYGYKIMFVQHPTMRAYVHKFMPDKEVLIPDPAMRYRDIFAQSALLLTDYSSVMFDFAYLRKPVLYAHFDKEEFYGKHYVEGYFDDEKDGFGEVLYNIEDTINCIIEYMKCDCHMKPTYQNRCEMFYEFADTANCQRVYDALCERDFD